MKTQLLAKYRQAVEELYQHKLALFEAETKLAAIEKQLLAEDQQSGPAPAATTLPAPVPKKTTAQKPSPTKGLYPVTSSLGKTLQAVIDEMPDTIFNLQDVQDVMGVNKSIATSRIAKLKKRLYVESAGWGKYTITKKGRESRTATPPGQGV